MANDLDFLKVWANANKSKQTTKRSLSEFLNDYNVELSSKGSSTNNGNNASTPKKESTTDINSDFNNQAGVKKLVEKYGIDAYNFTYADLAKLQSKLPNMVFNMGDMDTPPSIKSKKDGFLGWFGDPLASKEEIADAEALLTLAKNNANRKLSETDSGAGVAAIMSGAETVVDTVSFGASKKLSAWKESQEKEALKKVGIDEKYYVPYSTAFDHTKESHPIASTVGTLAGVGVTLASPIGKGAVTKGVKTAADWAKTYNNILKASKTLGATKGAIRAAKLARTLPTIMTMATPAILTYNRQKSKLSDADYAELNRVQLDYNNNPMGKGNIDLTQRPIYQNEDGTISTVRSMTITEDGKAILIPTVVYGANGVPTLLTDDEAVEYYHKTGEHLGKFDSIEEADEYAKKLSKEQDIYYSNILDDKKDLPLEWLEKQIAAGNAQYAKGIVASLDFILPTEVMGKYDFISKVNDFYSDSLYSVSSEAQKSSSNLGKGWETAGEAVQVVTAALPNSITALFLAGANVPAQATQISKNATINATANFLKQTAQNPQYWTSLLQTIGTDYEEAKKNGANESVASVFAIISSAINAGIELGGIQGLPDKLINQLSGDVSKRTIRSIVVQWATSMLEEGYEEVLQSIVTNLTAKMLYNPNAPYFSTTDENAVINPLKALKEFSLGAIAGGFLGGGQVAAIETIYRGNVSRVGNALQEFKENIIATGLNNPQDTESYKLAEKLNNKRSKVTDYELGKLHLANIEQMEVKVGETFIDSNTNNIIKVIERNDETSTIELTTPKGKKETIVRPNNAVEQLSLNDRYKKVETTTETPAVANNTTEQTTPVATTETPTETTDVSFRKDINLKRVGKFYEVYGEDAMLLAEELDGVETTKAVVNGVETDVLRLPANLVEGNADAVSDEYNLVLSDKPKVENQPITNETTTTDETIPSAEENATESEISLVVNAMNDTFKPKAKEDLKNSDLKGDVEKFAELVSNFYKAHKTLSSFADYFTDKGAKVISAIEGKTDTVENTSKVETDNKTDVVSVIGETLTPQAKENLQDGDANENYNSMAETLIEVYKEDGTLEAFADFFTDGGKKVEAAIKGKIDNSDVAEVLKNEPESDTIKSTTETNSIEREDNGNESIREDLLHGNGKRGNDGSTQKQAERLLSFGRKNKGRDATERQNFTRELIERGQVKETTIANCKTTLINPEAYNDDMKSMVEEAKRNGIELRFVAGTMDSVIELDDGRKVTKRFRGIQLSPTKILVQYDNAKSPQMIAKHEIIHAKWNTPEIQAIKDTILDSLTEEDKQDILSQERYQHYMEAYKNDKEAVWQEFICDVMSGDTYYYADHIDIVNDYWYGNETIEGYNAADYATSKDAGGNDAAKGRYDLSDEGGEHDEKSNNGRGISGISKKPGDKRGRDTDSERGSLRSIRQVSISKNSEKQTELHRATPGNTARSSRASLDDHSIGSLAMGRKGEDGSSSNNRRFAEALKNNDELLARDLLDEQATKNGYVPVTRYRGEKSETVKTSFADKDIVWVSKSFDYAKEYAQNGEFTDAKMSEQLHTSKHSNIYDLYAKYGKILELGDIEQTIEDIDDLNNFANRIGFTVDELIDCMDNYREHGVKEIFAITYTKKFADLAREKGYDSLHTLEGGGKFEAYGILYPENVKSAKLKTYDDKGKLIPLSERFDNTTNDIRYDLDDAESEYLELAKNPEKNEAQLSRMIDEDAKANGYNIKAYHGTSRADRVGTVFRPDRATSGPMAFFTDNKEIATNYARDKSDTSLAYDEEYDSYYTQFRVNRDGKSISIPELWKHLSISEKNKIKELAGQIKFDDDYENIIVDKSAKHGNGAYDAYTLNMHRGNVLEALVDTWLETGDLYRREADFLDVLKLVGIEDAEYRNPDARQEKVYDTWLKIQNPFDTEFADKSFYNSLSKWIETHDMSVYEKETSNADMWDKNNQTPETWLEKLDNDIENGTTHAWTVIPDFVTDYLKEQKYDGIKDKGGKGGGDGHTVWIPFSSEQIKSAEPVTYDDKGNVILRSERFNENNKDIRYDLDDEKSYAPTFYSQMGKVIDEMKQDKISAIGLIPYLKGKGVKNEEIKWSGIETLLEGKKSVTKAELQEFVSGSQLQIEENTLSEDYKIDYTEEESSELDFISELISEKWEEMNTLWEEKFGEEIPWEIRFADDDTHRLRKALEKRFKNNDKDYSFYDNISKGISEIERANLRLLDIVGIAEERTNNEGNVKSKWHDYKLDGGRNYREITFKLPNSEYSNTAMQAHWGDNAKGILAHARIQDFDVDGKKMLFIEEIQSDWHNEGAKRGYAKKDDADIRAKRQELENYIKSRLGKENSAEEITKIQEARAEYIRLGQNMSNANAIPDAPFKDNYHEYVLKTLIRMAAEQGYDSIGWTPADIQSKRWSGEYAEGYRIEYDQDIPKFLNKYGKKWGAKVGKASLNGTGSYTDYFEFEGAPTEYYTVAEAERGILDRYNQTNPEQQVSKVDTMLLAGQYVVFDSATAKEIGRFDRVNAPTKVWSMDITDSMKQSVLYEGQPRYDIDSESNLETQKKIEKMAKEITSHEDFISLTKQNTKEFVVKIKENESLQKRLKNAKRQMLLSPKPSVNIAKVGKVTKDILAEMDSTLKATDLKDRVTSIYNEYFADIKKAAGVESKTQEANDNMMKRFAELAVDIADSAEVYTESEEYGALKSYLKDVRIRLPESAKSDAHYAEFRKSHMGTFNLTNDGLEMDVVYQELTYMFPGMFDESITHPADQLYAIADTLEGLKPYAYNPHLEYMQDAIDHIVYRFASEVDGLAAMPKTKAQKIAEKGAYDKEMALEKERASFERKLDKHKKNSEKTIQALQKKIGDSEYVRYWEKRLSKEEKAQAVKEVRDKRDIAILKTKIRNLVSDMKKKLDKTEKNGGYPKELVQAVADVCSVIDFHTDRTNKDGSPTKASLKLDALKMQYDALKNSPNYDFQSEHSEEISNKILELHQKVQNKRVVDLTKTELEELKNILSAINHSLSIASKQIGKENAKANFEIFTEIVNDLEQIDKGVTDSAKQIVTTWRLAVEKGESWVINPNRIFEMVANYDKDSAFWKLYEGILQGERDRKKFTMDATMPFDELTSGGGNEVAYYDFRTKKVKTGIKYTDGTEVEIPKSIICELVMLWDRKDGKKHLASGGMKIPDMKRFNKGETKDAMTNGKLTTPITQADITRLKGMLDSYDKAWIERAYHLFNKVGKDAINETSMQLLGREIAKANNYIRIYVDPDFVRQDINLKSQDITIEGHGSLKETDPTAQNPAVLRGLQENVYDHIDFVSKYHGLAIPIRNFNKVYKLSDVGGNGHRSIKSMLDKKFGSSIRDNVIVRSINELQNPRRGEPSIFNKIRGNWLDATFWGNVPSMLKQTTSYWTAASILDESSLVKGLGSYLKHRKQTKSEIANYSGTLYQRSQGLSTTELGDRANRKRLLGASSKTSKVINKVAPWLRNVPEGIRPSNWLQSMDCATSSALWDACKHQVSKTMNESEDGYMKAVTDLYERVIEETQSNYDILHRPEVLKSTNEITKTFSMFQNDNLQQTGILKASAGNLISKQKAYNNDKSEANKQALDEALKRMDKAVRARIYSCMWLAVVKVLGDALWRKFKPYIDDEENEITARSVLEQMKLNMCEDMIGVFAPIVGELYSSGEDTFTKGWDFMNVPALDTIEEFIKATSKIWDAATNDEEGDFWKTVSTNLRAISNMTRIPAKNIYDMFNSVKGYAGDIKVGEFAHDLEDYTSGNKSFYDYGDLASYIVSGNTEKETKWKDYYSANGKEFAKGSLTKEIKPTYVQMYIDFPERAYSLKKKLVLDYDYTEADINEWIYDEYLKHIVPGKKFADKTVSNPEYAIEIRTFAKQNNTWNASTALKSIQSKYKEVYKKEAEKGEDRTESSALRKALLDDGVVSTSSFTQWEREVDNGINQEKIKLDAEKNKFKD